jgi:pimeloyl-ACP methyl ester carboxylesterase
MEKNLLFQNKSISYWIEGKGKPLMLVHGFAEDHHIWEHQVAHLQDQYQLILPDLPGSGKSSLVNDVSMENMAEVLKAIFDQESVSSCAIIGHSMGGYITLAFAEKYAARLNSFTLFHSTAYADNDEKKQTRLKAIEFMKKNGVEEFLKTSTPNLFAKETTDDGLLRSASAAKGRLTTSRSRQMMIDELIALYKDMSAAALIAYYEAMMKRPDRTGVLKSFTKPILFLFGKYDTAVPYEQGIEQSRLAKNGEVQTLHQSGHMGMWEEKEKSNHILEAFFKNNVS